MSCALRKGGSTINEIIHQQTANDGFGQHSCAGVALAELIVGDYINLYATIRKTSNREFMSQMDFIELIRCIENSL